MGRRFGAYKKAPTSAAVVALEGLSVAVVLHDARTEATREIAGQFLGQVGFGASQLLGVREKPGAQAIFFQAAAVLEMRVEGYRHPRLDAVDGGPAAEGVGGGSEIAGAPAAAGGSDADDAGKKTLAYRAAALLRFILDRGPSSRSDMRDNVGMAYHAVQETITALAMRGVIEPDPAVKGKLRIAAGRFDFSREAIRRAKLEVPEVDIAYEAAVNAEAEASRLAAMAMALPVSGRPHVGIGAGAGASAP